MVSVIEIIGIGLASGIFTVLIGALAAKLMLNRIEERASAEIDRLIVEKGTAFLKLLHDNPEMFAPIANGLLNDLTKIVKLPALEVAGRELTGQGIEALIPMLPRRWRGPAMLASMFMQRGATDKKETASSGLHG